VLAIVLLTLCLQVFVGGGYPNFFGWPLIVSAMIVFFVTSFSGRAEKATREKKKADWEVKYPVGGQQRRPSMLVTRRIYSMPRKVPSSFVIFDLETTGLSAEYDKIVQLGAIRVVDGAVVEEMELLISIDIPMPAKASQINGITDAMLRKNGKPLSFAIKGFYEFCDGLPLMAYNARFDASFLDVAAEQNDIEFDQRAICLLRFARQCWPELSSHKLSSVTNYLGCKEVQQHKALSDCYLALVVFKNGLLVEQP